MPDYFVWSLVPPLGFQVVSYTNRLEYLGAILAGQVQNPEGGVLHLLPAKGTEKPPIEIYVTHTAPSTSFGFSLRQVEDKASVTGFTKATYFFEDGTVIGDTDGSLTHVFPEGGVTIVQVVLDDARVASVVVDSDADAEFSVPFNLALPVITGEPQVSQVLRCSTGTWRGNPTPTYSYQWFSNGVAISNATLEEYMITANQLGRVIHCQVLASNTEGSTPADTSPTNPVYPVLARDLPSVWEDAVTALQSDSDFDAFVLEHGLVVPKSFGRKTPEKKREWLLAQSPEEV